jgi:hypothetical protein
MKKLFAILGLLFLISVSSAEEGYDPRLENQFDQMMCWGRFADSLGWHAQDYYDAGHVDPPAYLQQYRDDLYEEEDSALWDIYVCMNNSDPICFNSNLPRVMSLVYQLKSAYRTEARYALSEGWVTRPEVMNDYSGELEDFFICLEGDEFGGPE